mmetsp:Transcript_28337/g.91794  ORF Transcript_28337/g.91794 Transcript_28337/m.91794 type:complete len:89 (-) Transcript_28337:304-570(-)
MVTRCCSPPDSWAGTWSRRWPMPTRVSSSRARARRSAADSLPNSTMGSSTFSMAVIVGNKLNVWNTNEMWRRRRAARAASAVSEVTRS